MNYQLIYNSIIQKARSEQRVKGVDIYYENHHIIPKCLGGDDSKDNKVLLTAREHYVCHKLLVAIYPNNEKLFHAWFMIVFVKTNFQKRYFYITSREYEMLRSEISIKCGDRFRGVKPYMYGKNHSDEAKLKMSKIRSNKYFGVNHPLFGIPLNDLTKNKISKSLLGHKDSEKVRKNKSIGHNKEKFECKYCGKITDAGNIKQWHGENCKLKIV